jgi:AcrR family transcriptional regulator
MPRDTLTVDQIVRASIELLDAEGLDGLNMRSLGSRLNCAATAVYWHVKSKDNLVRLAADETWREIDLPDPASHDWKVATTALATNLHAMMSRHPWLVQALASHLLYGPAKARFDEHTLAIHETAGFTNTQADQIAAAVFTYVLGNAIGAAATVSLTRRLNRDGDAEQALRKAMASASEIAKQYPRLRTRLDQPAAQTYTGTPDDSFHLGLHALLDGLTAHLATHPTLTINQR